MWADERCSALHFSDDVLCLAKLLSVSCKYNNQMAFPLRVLPPLTAKGEAGHPIMTHGWIIAAFSSALACLCGTSWPSSGCSIPTDTVMLAKLTPLVRLKLHDHLTDFCPWLMHVYTSSPLLPSFLYSLLFLSFSDLTMAGFSAQSWKEKKVFQIHQLRFRKRRLKQLSPIYLDLLASSNKAAGFRVITTDISTSDSWHTGLLTHPSSYKVCLNKR